MVVKTEILNTDTEDIRSERAFSDSLGRIAGLVPELDERRDEIDATGRSLIGEFEIGPDFFSQATNVMLFASISDRWSRLGQAEDLDGEKQYLTDALGLLSYAHTDKFPEVKASIDRENGGGMNDEQELEVYDRYTDTQLTEELVAAINDGMLDEVKQRLGVNSENEQPYEVKVLNITTHSAVEHGLAEPTIDMDQFAGDVKSMYAAMDEQAMLRKNFKDWKESLVKRGLDFAAQMGREVTDFAPAWVRRGADGKAMLCLTTAAAKKLLHPESTGTYYTEDDRKREIAALEHEYVHTQDGLRTGDFGIALEEMRAERNSGSKLGYLDVKSFFKDIECITEFSVNDLVCSHHRASNAVDAYAEIARSIGIDNMLDVLLVSPRAYADQPNANIIKLRAGEYIGGMDGITQRLMQREASAGRGSQMDQRITAYANRIMEITKGKPEGLLASWRRHGRSLMAEVMQSAISK